MANKRLQREMQAALDDLLSPEKMDEMFSQLASDKDAATQFEKLKRVDSMLRQTPHARAPERMAVRIMEKLASQMQTRAQMEALPEVSAQALMLTLSLVMMVMMPMMVAASWLVLNMRADPELLSVVTQRMIALLVILIRAMEVLLEAAEKLVREDPKMAPVAMALIPFALLNLMKYLHGEDDEYD